MRNFNPVVYKAFLRCPMAVMKADLWRYCIIYYYGGIYADYDTICLDNPNHLIKDSQLLCTSEYDSYGINLPHRYLLLLQNHQF